jgi:hypothetical protein
LASTLSRKGSSSAELARSASGCASRSTTSALTTPLALPLLPPAAAMVSGTTFGSLDHWRTSSVVAWMRVFHRLRGAQAAV